MQYAQLNNGQSMPMLGLGTYTLTGKRGVDIMLDALELGYRLLDTAKMYGNEREVARLSAKAALAVRSSLSQASSTLPAHPMPLPRGA